MWSIRSLYHLCIVSVKLFWILPDYLNIILLYLSYESHTTCKIYTHLQDELLIESRAVDPRAEVRTHETRPLEGPREGREGREGRGFEDRVRRSPSRSSLGSRKSHRDEVR